MSPIVTSTWETQPVGATTSPRPLLPPDLNQSLPYSTAHRLEHGHYDPLLDHNNHGMLPDARLQHLDISKWTDIQIHSDLAARMISYYLEAYHPTFGFFDAELFVNSLTTGYGDYCSQFLVSSLLYWVSVCTRTGAEDSEAWLTDFSMPTDH